MASLFDTVHTHEYDESSDDASVRIIDKSVMDKPSDPDANDLEVLELVVPKRQKEKKKVMINESANQIRHAHEPQLDPDQFISMDHALGLLHHHVQTMQDNIEKEIKRIRVYQEDIVKYREHMILMDTQLDTMHYSLTMMHKDIPEMKAQKERVQENEIKVRSNQKKHNIQKHRFEKYRKAISIDTRLVELKKKIDAAWKRDEIWASIRDWGLLSGRWPYQTFNCLMN
ncbi:uncharacterized protein B0P05DRAFT_574824 [Gilbertella persicaria]|uniref:uncharacterized protein n=1 Tax=Gilbertella persicaria TaxID=101096 RepID=UPI0022201BEE|nr:uncharacterized protein B0P05DRAFT_574824 [Gilbertella persicaria]KAI8059957.1 hypothetical protein B0P05DRAFT_574824 [Gilbertella persicaria]